jgi:diguanylate cyclase (GGDEF)-like protein
MEGALIIGELVRENIEKLEIPYVDGISRSITVSIGINCEVPPRYSFPAEFISKADKALYAAKEGGRNRVVSSFTVL